MSTYLVRDIAVGDTLGVRGPIGGYFVWAGAAPPAAPRRRRVRARPVAGDVARGRPHGPGRRARLGDHPRPAARTPPSSPAGCAPEPPPPPSTCRGRDVPPDAVAHRHAARRRLTLRPGRVDPASVEAAVAACGGAEADPAVFVCGPTSFVEAARRPARRARASTRAPCAPSASADPRRRARPARRHPDHREHHGEAGRHDE